MENSKKQVLCRLVEKVLSKRVRMEKERGRGEVGEGHLFIRRRQHSNKSWLMEQNKRVVLWGKARSKGMSKGRDG